MVTIPERLRAGFGFGTYAACESVCDALLLSNQDVRITVCENELDLEAVVARRPSLVVLAVKHIPLQDGGQLWLSDYFEKAGINYTGSKDASMKFDVNKGSAKKQIDSCGIKTAAFFTSSPNDFKVNDVLPLPYPLFLKPMDAADSNGIDHKSLVSNFTEFEEKIQSLHLLNSKPTLVEQYLPGREFTVAIVEEDNRLCVASIEIVAPLDHGSRILGEKVKSEDTEILKKVIDAKTLSKLSNIAVSVFRALGARDFARIDIKMDLDNECYFMEANLTPGMNKGSSYFPKAFEISLGLEFNDVIAMVVGNGLKRNFYSSLKSV